MLSSKGNAPAPAMTASPSKTAMRSLERQQLREPLGVLGGPAAAEVVADAAERGRVLVGVAGLSQAERHQPIFSSGAYSSISFRSL